MDDPEDDPWNTPDVHKNHNHPPPKPNGGSVHSDTNGFSDVTSPTIAGRTISQHATETPISHDVVQESAGADRPAGWDYFDGSGANTGANFSHNPQEHLASPFGVGVDVGGLGAAGPAHTPGQLQSHAPTRRVGGNRTGGLVEEKILVSLMPEKEGLFMFQHHNYEVVSHRRGSKVIRRYSDFVWLLDCLHKRYPFRVLPLLPPKRIAVNGNHMSNDGGFIEKRRRGLARFLNALTRHPVLSQEQLVVMFLTVPTVSFTSPPLLKTLS